jgi:hypothetical protein
MELLGIEMTCYRFVDRATRCVKRRTPRQWNGGENPMLMLNDAEFFERVLLFNCPSFVLVRKGTNSPAFTVKKEEGSAIAIWRTSEDATELMKAFNARCLPNPESNPEMEVKSLEYAELTRYRLGGNSTSEAEGLPHQPGAYP